jgi:predicted ATPase
VGKTRLAVQVAAELLPSFVDGAWLCELAAAGDADSLAQVVASTLGVAQRAGRSLEQSIVEFLRPPARLLLVLDNCEHLLDASGRLAAAILAGCPGVRVLATSREALAIPGEQLWPLRSLELPDSVSNLDKAGAVGSGRLFCERAAGARPGFVLSEANVAAVVEVCRRLDGIPLAIELAAARVAALTPAEIAGLLDERFRLLTGGRRTAVERHQTLRAAVDWSYALLSATERVVFDRLAVFSGGFTLAAASAVVTGEGIEDWDIVDALGGLVAKSMVVAEPGGEHTRYQLLETLRQYGRERLHEDGDTDRWRRRHARHFSSFAAEVAGGLRGRDELAWRERLLGDLDNLRSAVVWGLDSGVEENRHTAVAIIARLAYESTTLATGIGRWAERALPALRRSTPGFRGAVLGAAAAAAFYRGDLDASERHARAALEDGYPPDNPSPCLAPIYLMVILVSFQGRKDDGARHLDAAEKAILGRDDEDYVRSWLQNVRVSSSLFADDPDEEIAQGRLGMSLAQRTGNPSILALASFALGWTLRHRHPDEALAAFDQSVVLARRGASTSVLPVALSCGAQAAAALGDVDGASARLRDALEDRLRDDDWTVLTQSLDAAVDIFSYRGEARAAAVLAGAVETTLAPLRPPYISSRGPALAARTANLARAKQELGESCYQQARAEGVAMSRQDALAFALEHL